MNLVRRSAAVAAAAFLAVSAAVAVVPSPGNTASAASVRAYHIGNSVTDTLRYNGVTKLAQADANTYTFGKHISPGVKLSQTWNYQSNTGTMYSANGFGLYRTALKNYTWDAVTLQPFDSALLGSSGDLQMVKNFINYTTPKSPNSQFYVYQRWPRKVKNSSGVLTIDYQKKWVQTHNYDTSTTSSAYANETRGYFDRLLYRVNLEKPAALKKKVLMVPVGEVMFEVDKRMRAGLIPGYRNISQIYTDHIHLNHFGSYIVGLTFYSTMYRDNPVGGAVPANWNEANITSTQRRQLQEAVWKVVSTYPTSGVRLGDTSRDGILNLDDADVIRGSFNLPAETVGAGDANLDGVVSIRDFAMLASNINADAMPTAAAVPEPGTAAVALAAAAPLLLRRRRR